MLGAHSEHLSLTAARRSNYKKAVSTTLYCFLLTSAWFLSVHVRHLPSKN
ncbi:hypothetical protein MCHLDSM_04240 [Mycolicibacterium chlorophenolicum]|uniref:Uncharacterized protein n=1 Tax=Mycolicibacterium chlorophenolicum TaxID=37916 RepID=A0A0J6VQW3_9MYCO|nr:hypothetical protein MCHLDSM_04240 [Mycolicibacterium chlorophenolicum]